MMTDKQKLQQQDFVDNKIQNMITELNPTEKSIHWNIEIISQIRLIVQEYFVDGLEICTEEEFYPYL